MSQTAKRPIQALIGVFVALALALTLFLFSRGEVSRLNDPSGRYTLVVSKLRYQSFIFRFPGDSGGPPGFVEIFDRGEKSFGRVSVEMINFAGAIEWTSSGASIPAVAEWDFIHGTCCYWTHDGTRQVWVKR
jgi:hypothetical protein